MLIVTTLKRNKSSSLASANKQLSTLKRSKTTTEKSSKILCISDTTLTVPFLNFHNIKNTIKKKISNRNLPHQENKNEVLEDEKLKENFFVKKEELFGNLNKKIFKSKITPSVKTVKKKDNDFLCSLQFEFEPLEIFKEDGNVKEIEDDQSINNKEICNSNVNQKLNKRKNSLNLIRLDFEYLNFLEKNNSFFDFKFLNSIKSHNKKKKKTLILNDFDEGGCYQPLLNTVDHRTNIPCF